MDSTNFLDLDGEDKENFSIPTIPDGSDVPVTPLSLAFPSSSATSDAESDKPIKPLKLVDSSSSNSAKSVRWAEMALFPEQQSLVNIHGLLKTLLEDCKDEEIVQSCEMMGRYLPQRGVLAERK